MYTYSEMFLNKDNGLKGFHELSINTWNKHTPHKKKYTGGNQMPFLTKNLSKKLWLDQDFIIITWKTGMKKIKPYM